MELAYYDNNKRELELTRHVSLRQLDPLALLTLKATGRCQVTIPEWLYDRDCPGHYMRRIKSVALTIPSVVGPYTSLNCTLTLLNSSIRKSPLVGGAYPRQGAEDSRFVDYAGSTQSVVTSAGQNDSGMFETNLRDERFLPFEGAGAISSWQLELPTKYPAFDYTTISDVIFHIRYTARQGVDPNSVNTALSTLFGQEKETNFALLFNLRSDFPTDWATFASGTSDFKATVRRDFFPYFAAGSPLAIKSLVLQDATDPTKHAAIGDPDSATMDLQAGQFAFSVPSAQISKSSPPFLIVGFVLS